MIPTKEANEFLFSAGESVEYAKQYIDQQKNLVRIEVAEKTAVMASSATTAFILGTLGLLAVLFASVGVALLIGRWLDNYAYGFFILALIYILITVLLFLFQKTLITKPVLSAVISKFFHPVTDSVDGN